MKPPIDRAHLERYVIGDKALLDEILTIFCEQTASWVNEMHPVMDDEAWRLSAHTLKGSARGVGAFALGEAAERAERLVGPGVENKRRAALLDLADCAAKAIDYARFLRAQAA
jgi:HPt (histidine-containing phosphotransfer) domain-containing protein